ncbi:hypothetical protein [Vitiosangium sp. GDMCC 1.1324]|uniref:hypothetical protein n=1 Tax=Vitiosangium sp. (strain GDMCC 1.1324) TaxID=2138576 RepID=UPI000D35D0DA|nr:hypothetical protein [Vitiosangium sp. GDMCC 1.1324]PTL79081.1 hypothetical protein DAT35_36340 [Vitiosangium sp. GDMCC 1.1324]
MTCPVPTYSIEVPVKTASTSNLREHWAARHKRTDAQKAATRRRCPEWTAGPLLVVRLARVAPRKLDDDNLRGALKSVRDAIATWLRVDDASPLVRWEYLQERGPTPLVRVEVWLPHLAQASATIPPVTHASTDAPVGQPGFIPALLPAQYRQRSLAELATPASYPAALRRTP